MGIETLLIGIILIVGFYMAWNIGANDVSNAMGTSVGSRALTLKQAVMIAAILEFCGAFFLGGNVSSTMQSELIQVTRFGGEPQTLILGMCGALLGTGIWLQLASYFGLPVSTTHAIVGAIIGFGAWTLGPSGVEWGMIGSIALSWVISPVMSGFISYLIFYILERKVLYTLNPAVSTKRFLPILLFFVFFTFALSLIYNGLGRLHLSLTFPQALLYSVGIGIIAALIGFTLVNRLPTPAPKEEFSSPSSPHTLVSLEKAIKHMRRVKNTADAKTEDELTSLLDEMYRLKKEMREKTRLPDRISEYRTVEKLFSYMQIISACFVAFAHGANDVANAIAPVASVIDTIRSGVTSTVGPVPSWLLAFGGIGIVVGLATWGWRVIETIGRKITELTPTRGFSAEFGAAITILIASKVGLPISTTHCLVGSVLGVGIAGGIRAINLRTLREIALSWVITIPLSAFISILAFLGLRAIFG